MPRAFPRIATLGGIAATYIMDGHCARAGERLHKTPDYIPEIIMDTDADAIFSAILRTKSPLVLSTDQLDLRAARQPDYATENAALVALANALAGPDDVMLQALAETAMRLCCADSAGISVIEAPLQGETVFRWVAAAGFCQPYVNTTTPAARSPCDITLALGGPQLFAYPPQDVPSSQVPPLQGSTPDIVEALVITVPSDGKPKGAIWVMSHRTDRTFDREDCRVLASLASFTGAALNLRYARRSALTETTESQRIRAELGESEARKDEFIAMLGHELRNPMAPIDSAIAVARRLSDGNQQVLDVLSTAQRQMRHLRRLVDDLLDASRIKHGKLSISLDHASLNEIVYDAVSAVKHHLDSRGHTLSLVGLDAPINVRADHIRLSQMLGNLLSNAAKYTPHGGKIGIEIRCLPRADADRDDDASLSGNPLGGEVIIAIRDNGIGISAELLPRVFELFTQNASDSARSQGGLGIGLSVVKRMVELHRGTVEIASDGLGHGTLVTLRLPILSRSDHYPPLRPANPPSSTRILLVDDNADALQALGMLLELEGHEVQMANGGEAALQLTQHYIPQVALIDIGMPGIDGFQLVQMLRARPQLSQTKLVALTGYASESERSRALSAGFDFHLTKPLSLDKLFDVLTQFADDRTSDAL